MKVKELIEELKKCDSDDIVMYNFENAAVYIALRPRVR